jgi:hypothetical protein
MLFNPSPVPLLAETAERDGLLARIPVAALAGARFLGHRVVAGPRRPGQPDIIGAFSTE